MMDGWELPAGEILAPMSGVSDSPFRRIARGFGAGLLYTECISAEGIRRLSAASLELARFHPCERPIAVQLFGSQPDQFAAAAAIIAERCRPDMIDINCGCPVRRFVTIGSGGSLMRDPGLVGRIVERVRRTSGLPVSVKLRAGYMPPEETVVEAAQSAEAAGAALVAVNARYVRGGDEGADWDVIARVRAAVGEIPVVGNGDVRSREDVRRMMGSTGCDRVMIGRQALGRPWIFAEAGEWDPGLDGEPPLELRLEALVEHYRLALDWFEERRAARLMRKHIGWYTKGMPDSAGLRRDAVGMEGSAEALKLVNDYRVRLLKGDFSARATVEPKL